MLNVTNIVCLSAGRQYKDVTLSIGNKIMRKKWTKRGFTLIEILVVLAIIGFLVGIIVPRLNRMREDAAVITSLSEMKSIKEAIKDRFYPDLGLIPEDLGPDGVPDSGDERAEFAIRYLCLKDDGVGSPIGPERQEMLDFLSLHGKDSLIIWDKYSRRGWRGPYIEQEARHDYDGLVGAGTDWWPVIVNSWASYWENRAGEEEKLGNDVLADRYREHKCYYIFGGQDKNEARIICFGADGEENDSVTIGGSDYVCIKTHTADSGNHPETGANGKEYWVLDSAYSGGTWSSGTKYKLGDDLVMFIFGVQPARRP